MVENHYNCATGAFKSKSSLQLYYVEFHHDINVIGSVQAELKALKLQTAHLVCVGGWNAPHPDTSFTGKQWFEVCSPMTKYLAYEYRNMFEPY